jgi:signal recognition particle receptor subunit beta
MPQVNTLARELVFKVVYYGPGLGGKTTSLQYVHATTRPEHRGKMVSLATPVDRTLYFDFLPIRVPTSRDMTVRLQLFTVPGQVYFNATRKLVLTGADGVVFVADSQIQRADANYESFRNLEENLAEQGRSLDEMPHVFAYNKRDLPNITPLDEMEQLLNTRGAPSFATVATLGEGVYEELEAITRAVIEDFDRRVPEHRGLSPSPLMLPEGGLAEALRLVDGDGHPWSAPPIDKPKKQIDPGFSLPPDDDVGEEAARVIADVGTRPGVGLEQESSTNQRPSTDSSEPMAQSHFRPVPVPLNGFGMRSTPPPSQESPPVSESHSAVEKETDHSLSPVHEGEPLVESKEEKIVSRGVTLSILWPPRDRDTVIRIEEALSAGETREALFLVDILMQRLCEELAQAVAMPGLHATSLVNLLGVRGDELLKMLVIVERAKSMDSVILKEDVLRALLLVTNAYELKARLIH